MQSIAQSPITNSMAMGQLSQQRQLNAIKDLQTAASDATKDNQMTDAEMKRIKDTAKDFEAVFLSEMLKPMFEGVTNDPMFGSSGQEVFHGMLVQEYGRLISDQGGVGIAQHMEKYMIQVQEGAQ